MVGKIVTGKSFIGLAKYLTADTGRVAWIATRNTFESKPGSIASEMHDEALSSSRTKKPVLHIAIALDPADKVTRADLERIADRTLKDLGLSHHQAMIVAHADKAHTHIHLMVNRVHGGRAWDGFRDRYRLRLSLEAHERDMGLRRTGRNAEREADRPPRSRQDSADGRLFAAHVRSVAGDAFRTSTSWKELEARLASHGLRLEARGTGMVVTDGAKYAKLSAVNREWSRPKLEARLGAYEREAGSRRPQRERKERTFTRSRRGRGFVIPRTHVSTASRRVRDLAVQPGRSADEAVMRDVTRRSVSLAMKLGRHGGRDHEPVMRLVDLGRRYDAARQSAGERHLAGRPAAAGPTSRQLGREIVRQAAGLGVQGQAALEKLARGEGPASLAAKRVLALIEKVRGVTR